MAEKDQYQRWEVSLPCSIEWDDRTLSGTVIKLTLRSALITLVDVVPPEGAPLILTLQADQGEEVHQNHRNKRHRDLLSGTTTA